MVHFIKTIKQTAVFLISIFLLFSSCDRFPKEEEINYSDGKLKTRITLHNKYGKRDVENYSNDGRLSFVYHWKDSNGNGLYEEYFENGFLRKRIYFKNDTPYSVLSYDQNEVLYNEKLSKYQEKTYRYYNDTTLFEISYLSSFYKGDEKVKIIEDSVMTFSDNDLIIKTISVDGGFIIERFDNTTLVSVDTFSNYKAYRYFKDSLLNTMNLPGLYQFKLNPN